MSQSTKQRRQQVECPLFLPLFILLVLLYPTSASAWKVTGVQAPDLVRPCDGQLYPFDIVVSFMYEAGDIGGITDTVRYWDNDGAWFVIPDLLDDLIDGNGALSGAGGLPGTTDSDTVTLMVGCRTDPLVFGDESTGENPMDDGMFEFVTEGSAWGFNTVECEGPCDAESYNLHGLQKIPEPGTLSLLLFGGLMLTRRRR